MRLTRRLRLIDLQRGVPGMKVAFATQDLNASMLISDGQRTS